MREIWKDIGGYTGLYQVSNLGRVQRLFRKRKKIKSQVKNRDGYMTVSVSTKSIVRVRRVHRLVALAFIPNPKDKETVNHKNGIKSDNHLENLEWSTRKENTNHAWKNHLCENTRKLGENNNSAKLSWKEVDSIRQEYQPYKNGYLRVAEKYNVSKTLIEKIIKKEIWVK